MICPYCGFAVMNADSDLKQCSRIDGAEHYFTVDGHTGVATRGEKPEPATQEPPTAVEEDEHQEDVRTDDPPAPNDPPQPPPPPATPVPVTPSKQPKR